jgi:hypothetical protein
MKILHGFEKTANGDGAFFVWAISPPFFLKRHPGLRRDGHIGCV